MTYHTQSPSPQVYCPDSSGKPASSPWFPDGKRSDTIGAKPKIWPAACSIPVMHPSTFLGLLEELIDIKVQQQTEAHLKTSPEVAAVLHQKRETDKRRIDQIRAELLRLMSA